MIVQNKELRFVKAKKYFVIMIVQNKAYIKRR